MFIEQGEKLMYEYKEKIIFYIFCSFIWVKVSLVHRNKDQDSTAVLGSSGPTQLFPFLPISKSIIREPLI
jgi:hypothetical protein